jgi:1-acyl-sn-glycerol-3-phosphate acyltransferase
MWWPPRLNSFWIRVIRPFRILRQRRRERLRETEIYGLDHLRRAVDRGDGVLIVSNHAANPDPYLLLAVGDKLGLPFYYLVAWQLLEIYGLTGRWILRRHGCFSINREGTGLAGYRRAVDILRSSPHPLVLFPEGEIYHNNDYPAPFRTGAAAIALSAAHRAQRRIVCIPAAIRYWYLGDATPHLLPLLEQVERQLFGVVKPEATLAARVYDLAEELVSRREAEYLGQAQEGPLAHRTVALADTILTRLERAYGITPEDPNLPERVNNLRRLAVPRLEGAAPADPGYPEAARHLEDLHVAAQLFSYSQDYLEAYPTLEHVGEVLDKFEEDVLGAPTATPRADRRGAILFGEPIEVRPTRHMKEDIAGLTATLEGRVKELLKEVRVRGERGVAGPDIGPWPAGHPCGSRWMKGPSRQYQGQQSPTSH